MRLRSVEPSGEQVDVGDGLEVPAEITIAAEDVNGYDVHAVAAYRDGRYVLASVAVSAGDGEQEVTGEGLRGVPVATILRNALTVALTTLQSHVSAVDPDADLAEQVQAHKWQAVARVYRVALLIGEPPTAAVAEAFDVSRATAGRWVTRARDRGNLTVSDPRGPRRD